VIITRAQVASQAPAVAAWLSPIFDTLPAQTQQQHLWIAQRSFVASSTGTLPPDTDPSVFQWVQSLWRTLTGETITAIYGVPTPTGLVVPDAPAQITAAIIPTATALQPAPTPVAPAISAAVNTPAAATSAAIPTSILDPIKAWFEGDTFGVPNKILAVGVLVGAFIFMGNAPAPRRGRL
jgi:hypothetical protein